MSGASLPGAPAEPKAGSSSGGLKGMAKRNPNMVVGAGAVGIVVLVALMSKKGAGDTAGGAETTATTGQINPSNGGYYDSTANDVYNSLMGQFVTLQQQVAALTPGASTPTPTPTPTTPAVSSAAHLAHLAHLKHLQHVAIVAQRAKAAAKAKTEAHRLHVLHVLHLQHVKNKH